MHPRSKSAGARSTFWSVNRGQYVFPAERAGAAEDRVAARALAPATNGSRHPACEVGAGQRCQHALTDRAANEALRACELGIQQAFADLVPALQEIAALQHERDFVARAQLIAEQRLGFRLPQQVLEDAWVLQLDMRKLYAHCVFQTFLRVVNQRIAQDVAERDAVTAAQHFFLDCGYHEVDISPCADGRLKGLERFVLRLPLQALRSTKAYAGALFDVEGDLSRWQRIELRRHREGQPTPAAAGTRYLKVAVYHTSSSNPLHEGCAAHGSNETKAAEAALARLEALRQAVGRSFEGATIDILLIGLDTDTDSIKIHLPDARGNLSLHRAIQGAEVYRDTLAMSAEDARRRIETMLDEVVGTQGWGQGNGPPHPGMRRFVTHLLVNNLSQIEYVIHHHGGRYGDIGHRERFIAVGANLDALQLRNLAYYAHLYTVEEGAADVDVGVKIFRGLNVSHGLPIPVLVHYRFNERVPGSRERAIERCTRVREALLARHRALAEAGLLECAMTIRGKARDSRVEIIDLAPAQGGH